MSDFTEMEVTGKPRLGLSTSLDTILAVHLNKYIGIQTRSSFHAKIWKSPNLCFSALE